MTTSLPPASVRRRLLILGLTRAFALTVALVIAYFALPLDRLGNIPFCLSLAVGLAVLTAVTVYQVHAILRAPHPAVRAVEALAATVPVFILLFAATYYALSQTDPANFNTANLARTDTLYFTVTVFATVGFGDITATSTTARMLVTVQMLLDLVVLGAVIRVFVGAVRIARQNAPQNGKTAERHPTEDSGPPAG